MMDKSRAKAAGVVGEYIYPCPLDKSLLEFLGIADDAFYEAVITRTDAEVLDWLRLKASSRSPQEVEKWHQEFRDRGPDSEEKWNYFKGIRDRFAPDRTDVTTWVDLIDLEEGRDVPIRR
jgi:hypothetical protein